MNVRQLSGSKGVLRNGGTWRKADIAPLCQRVVSNIRRRKPAAHLAAPIPSYCTVVVVAIASRIWVIQPPLSFHSLNVLV